MKISNAIYENFKKDIYSVLENLVDTIYRYQHIEYNDEITLEQAKIFRKIKEAESSLLDAWHLIAREIHENNKEGLDEEKK